MSTRDYATRALPALFRYPIRRESGPWICEVLSERSSSEFRATPPIEPPFHRPAQRRPRDRRYPAAHHPTVQVPFVSLVYRCPDQGGSRYSSYDRGFSPAASWPARSLSEV